MYVGEEFLRCQGHLIVTEFAEGIAAVATIGIVFIKRAIVPGRPQAVK